MAAERVLLAAGCIKDTVAPLATRIHKRAKDFARVAFELHARISAHRQQAAYCLAPFAVTSALAIELYLKALASRHRNELRGHGLADLFDKLPLAAVEAISRHTTELISKYQLGEPREMRECLVKLNDSFVHWRYSYEFDSTPIFFLPMHALYCLEVMDRAFTLPGPSEKYPAT